MISKARLFCFLHLWTLPWEDENGVTIQPMVNVSILVMCFVPFFSKAIHTIYIPGYA